MALYEDGRLARQLSFRESGRLTAHETEQLGRHWVAYYDFDDAWNIYVNGLWNAVVVAELGAPSEDLLNLILARAVKDGDPKSCARVLRLLGRSGTEGEVSMLSVNTANLTTHRGFFFDLPEVRGFPLTWTEKQMALTVHLAKTIELERILASVR